MTYCTPYLLQLGLTKSKLSLVWIAGPLSGLIMQPIVGIMADKSTSRWGRRRPVMIGGTVIVSICLLILGWTKEIIAAFVEEGELVGQFRASTWFEGMVLTFCRDVKRLFSWLYYQSTLLILPSTLYNRHAAVSLWTLCPSRSNNWAQLGVSLYLLYFIERCLTIPKQAEW